MNSVYQFLCEFTKNTHPTRKHLIKRYGEPAVLEALNSNWICEFDKNDLGEIRYAITPDGKKKRDQ